MSLPDAAMRLACVVLLMCLQVHASQTGDLDVSGPAVAQQLLHLASFSDAAAPAVTRIVFTPNDLKARAQAPPCSQCKRTGYSAWALIE